LEIVQFLDMAIADLASSLMSFPNQACILGCEILVLGVNEGSIPTPSVSAGHPHALAQEMQCCIATHAATLRHVVGASISRAGGSVDQDDLKRRECVSDALELRVDISRGCHVAVGKMSEVKFDSWLQTPREWNLIDGDRPFASVHGGGEMVGRIEMRGVVRG